MGASRAVPPTSQSSLKYARLPARHVAAVSRCSAGGFAVLSPGMHPIPNPANGL